MKFYQSEKKSGWINKSFKFEILYRICKVLKILSVKKKLNLNRIEQLYEFKKTLGFEPGTILVTNK